MIFLLIPVLFMSCGSEGGTSNNNGDSNNDRLKTPKPTQSIINQYTADLEEMAKQSREQELQIADAVAKADGEEIDYNIYAEQTRVDSVNMIKLSKMLDANGWIATTHYGEAASNRALAILNKASSNYQVYYLTMVTNALSAGEIKPAGFAEVYDKAMIAQGKNQLYGTQMSFNETEGINKVHPIEDEANIEQRRKVVGLPPMTAYWSNFGIVYPDNGSSTDH
ncbi:MAG: DUF6624 domain-containing protein [Bacteroidota bacterium]